ncbi:MAG TPA: MauE/DoxX family redox-associated membrane protein [Thermoanaerobaculia bacterium]|jgi:hypothetical protein|nr:MauE/DoxX family redox-associated membrane protein [Thermoanaerobaculia bacterium]
METVVTLAPSASASSSPTWAWRRVLGYFGGAVLGLILLVAAGAKALDPQGFAEQIHAENLDFAFSAPAVALIGLGIEVAVGLALLLGLRRLWVLIPSALLVAFLVFLTARTYVRSIQGEASAAASCGCFGNLVQRTPGEAFWQDLLMLVPPLGLAFVGRPRGGRFPRGRVAAVALATGAVVAFGAKASELPLDDLATRLKPGVQTAKVCAGEGAEAVCLGTLVPDLARGNHMVVLADLDSATFTGLVPDLNRYSAGAEGQGARPLIVLSGSSSESKTSFFWKFGPAFEVREAPPALLRPLYRRLPRAFEVRDGQVARTFSTVEEIRRELGAPAAPAEDPAQSSRP